MNYEETVKYIQEAGKRGSVLGLNNMKNLMNKLGNVQDELKVLHIAGTNGKGSTSAYICEILMEAGCKVGKYTSPAVFDSLEIFKVDDVNISREDYALMMTKVKSAVDKMVIENMTEPTSFEIETAIAFLYFEYKKCDIAIIETGMGGKLDATNIIKHPLVSIITPISMDHMMFLGDTLEKITYNKAGIIKEGCTVVSAVQEKAARKVLTEEAFLEKAEIVQTNKPQKVIYEKEKTKIKYLSSKGNIYDVETYMIGTFQTKNVCTAIETAEMLRDKFIQISDKDIENGIKKAVWHGRFEKISDKPLIYFDGGHNPGAAKNIRESLEIYFTNKKIVYIIGVLGDKDYDKVLSITANLAYKIFTITPPENKRALNGLKLLENVLKYNQNAIYEESLDTAVEDAIEEAGEDGVIVIFGSLSYLREIKETIMIWKGYINDR